MTQERMNKKKFQPFRLTRRKTQNCDFHSRYRQSVTDRNSHAVVPTINSFIKTKHINTVFVSFVFLFFLTTIVFFIYSNKSNNVVAYQRESSFDTFPNYRFAFLGKLLTFSNDLKLLDVYIG